MTLGRSVARPLPRDPRPLRRIRSSVRAGFVWGVAAAACNVLLVSVAGLLGVPFHVWPTPQGQPVDLGPLSIVAATLVAAVLAGLLTGLAAKQLRRVARWTLLAGILVTAASLSGPLGQPPEVPTATQVILAIVNLITGTLVTLGLVRGLMNDDRAAK